MHRLIHGNYTAPTVTPVIARHGEALAGMTMHLKQPDDPPAASTPARLHGHSEPSSKFLHAGWKYRHRQCMTNFHL
jgi:hypothetical protein